MTCANLQAARGIAAGLLLVLGSTMMARADDAAGDNLTPAQILKQAREKYASLTSYRDEGKTINSVNGDTMVSTFTIRLARPSFYRIEWRQISGPPSSNIQSWTQAVWSAGEGDFVDLGNGKGAQKVGNREKALGSDTGISVGAVATIPGTFFAAFPGNQLGGFVAAEKRKPDEALGNVDCYVLASGSDGRERTLWIGKGDLLIHQVRNTTSVESLNATLAEAIKQNPGVVPPRPLASGISSTETHLNIVVNQTFSPADFVH